MERREKQSAWEERAYDGKRHQNKASLHSQFIIPGMKGKAKEQGFLEKRHESEVNKEADRERDDTGRHVATFLIRTFEHRWRVRVFVWHQ